MQTPWSHPAVREEFDEEIRLLVRAACEAGADERDGRIVEGTDGEAPLSHERQLCLWSLVALYAPWMSIPMDSTKLLSHASGHFQALRSRGAGHESASRYQAGEQSVANGAKSEMECLKALACASIAGIPGAREALDTVWPSTTDAGGNRATASSWRIPSRGKACICAHA